LLFRVPREVLEAAHEAVLSISRPSGHDAMVVLFDVTMFERGINALKAARSLCADGQWEIASAAARQLYELVLTAEHVARQPDRREAIRQYARFGLLQMAQEELRALRYDQRTGRPVDADRLTTVEAVVRSLEPSDSLPATGRPRRRSSWTGLTVLELASMSNHPLRKSQYDLLFSAWSGQLHAAPGALIGGLLGRTTDAARVMRDDDARIAETLSVCITLLLDLWASLPEIPVADPRRQVEWMSALLRVARRHSPPTQH
jgi:hypothetical protein